MLPSAISQEIEKLLALETGKPLEILSAIPLGGGCINEASRINTSSGPLFVKYNLDAVYPGMFAAESSGLQLLAEAAAIRVPGVAGQGTAGNHSFLLLEYITSGLKKPLFWTLFGRSLAALHRHSHAFFGLDHDNYMGSLPQSNRQHADWFSFFVEERLEPQVKLAREKSEIQAPQVKQFEILYRMLEGIIPPEKPALLHGDLWSGNFLTDENGEACLIDPAVHFGHRESDIAMTRLFGGFTEEFYTQYTDAYPLEKSWEKRVELFNLYPLLIHVNLFGGGYAMQVKGILNRFA